MKQALSRARGATLRYGLSLLEQGMGAALNFLFNLWLIRAAGASSYGVYVLWAAIALVMTSVVNAFTGTHLVPLPPGREHWQSRREIESVLLSVTIWLLFATGVITFGGLVGARALFHNRAPWSGAIFLPAVMLYQYGRMLAFSRGEVRYAAAMTAAVLALSLSALEILQLGHIGFQPEALLVIQALSYGIPGLVLVYGMSPGVRIDLRPGSLLHFRRYLGGSRWIMLGTCCYEIMTRFYSFLVAGMLGATALSQLSAAQVPLRPGSLVVNAWVPVVRAELVRHRRNHDWKRFRDRLVIGTISTALVTAALTVLVWWAWPLIAGRMYRGRYSDASMVVVFWGIDLVIAGAALALAVGLQATANFRSIALAELTGVALVVTLLPVVLMVTHDANYAVLAMSIGPLAQILMMLRALRGTRAAVLAQ